MHEFTPEFQQRLIDLQTMTERRLRTAATPGSRSARL